MYAVVRAQRSCRGRHPVASIHQLRAEDEEDVLIDLFVVLAQGQLQC